MKKINIIGCGGHARSVADVILGRYPDIEIVFWDVNAGKDEMIFSGDVSGGVLCTFIRSI